MWKKPSIGRIALAPGDDNFEWILVQKYTIVIMENKSIIPYLIYCQGKSGILATLRYFQAVAVEKMYSKLFDSRQNAQDFLKFKIYYLPSRNFNSHRKLYAAGTTNDR